MADSPSKPAAPAAKPAAKAALLTIHWRRGNECEMFTPFAPTKKEAGKPIAHDPDAGPPSLLGKDCPSVIVERSRVARYGKSPDVAIEARGADQEHNERSYQKLRQLVQCGHASVELEDGTKILTLHDLVTLLG